MIISLLLVLFVTVCGTVATYLYDFRAAFAARVCAGVCTGLAAFGLVGFIFASFMGLTPFSILLTLVVLALPLLALKNTQRSLFIEQDLKATYRSLRNAVSHPKFIHVSYAVFYLIVTAIFWWAFQRSMIVTPDGVYTGLINNFGDLPFHLSVITSFAFGNNFPPQDPTYAGVHFTYPFLTDFISAVFVRCGADLRQSVFIENFVVAVALVGLMHRWALEMLKDKLAAVLTPILVLLNGGFGWILFFQKATEPHDGIMGFLKSLPAFFTCIPETTWRWGNALSALLIPQRGILLGLPLAVIVFTQWWLATPGEETAGAGDAASKRAGAKNRKTKKHGRRVERSGLSASALPDFLDSPVRRMIAAGIIAGLLPLVHAHSFVVVMVVGACIALFQMRWRQWIAFFIAASLVALPQMWWSTHNSAVDATKFFEWHLGWDHGNENPVWFWFKNSGLFIPLTIAALLWRGRKPLVERKLLLFLLPFSLCFIIPNVLKMAPWIWDNIKVLFYWWLGAAPLVAMLLARLWHEGKMKRVLAAILFFCVTAAGGLDVAAIMLRPGKHQVFDANGVAFAEMVKEKTRPEALVLHAPVHNHPVFLTGRHSLMGYPGHVWTHGLEYLERESEIKRTYAGGPDALAILRKYKIDYLVVGPLERNLMTVNDRFVSHFALVGEVDGYRLYKITIP